MSIHRRLKAKMPGATDREVESIRDFWEHSAQSNRFLRSAHFQRIALQAERAFPRMRGLVGRPSDSAGEVFLKALQLIGDDTKTAQVAKLMGGTGKEERHVVLAHAAAALGFENGLALERDLLVPIAESEIGDRVALGRFTKDIEDRRASGREEDAAIPPMSAQARDQMVDEAQRRNTVANLYDRMEASRPPVQKFKKAAFDASSPLAVDIERAMAAHEGRAPMLDRNSQGVKAWMKERTAWEAEDAAVEAEAIRGGVQERQEYDRELRDHQMRTPAGAETVARYGSEEIPTVAAVERDFLDGEE